MVDQVEMRFELSYRGGPTISADLELDMTEDKVWVLFGHSGSGKTTFLRVLAGLEQPNSGLIKVDGNTWLDTSKKVAITPDKRHVGFLHQDYALFPHMSVDENILYGLKIRGVDDAAARLAHLKSMLRIEGFGNRRPGQISGGQRQRVALARALATRPQLLLLDEPLSALDAPTRATLRRDLRQWLHEFDIPTILVTHDRGEAMSLGHRVILQEGGQVLQIGTTQEVFSRPNSVAAARCVGMENLLPGRNADVSGKTSMIDLGGMRIRVEASTEVGQEVVAAIRAEDIQILNATNQTESINHIKGTVGTVSPEGALTRVTLVDPLALEFFVSPHQSLTPGEVVTLAIRPDAVHIIHEPVGRTD